MMAAAPPARAPRVGSSSRAASGANLAGHHCARSGSRTRPGGSAASSGIGDISADARHARGRLGEYQTHHRSLLSREDRGPKGVDAGCSAWAARCDKSVAQETAGPLGRQNWESYDAAQGPVAAKPFRWTGCVAARPEPKWQPARNRGGRRWGRAPGEERCWGRSHPTREARGGGRDGRGGVRGRGAERARGRSRAEADERTRPGESALRHKKRPRPADAGGGEANHGRRGARPGNCYCGSAFSAARRPAAA